MTTARKQRLSFDERAAEKSTTIQPDAAVVHLMNTVLSLLQLQPGESSNNGGLLRLRLGLVQALVRRCRELDNILDHRDFESTLLLSPTDSGGYTPLHWAVYSRNLGQILLLLRSAMNNTAAVENMSTMKDRMIRRPMDVLYATKSYNNKSGVLHRMATALDGEGMTAADLLAALQTKELSECRVSLLRTERNVQIVLNGNGRERRRSRGNSWVDERNRTPAYNEEDEQNEFDVLSRAMTLAANNPSLSDEEEVSTQAESEAETTFGCEVFTFGRAHHCALGVVVGQEDRQQDQLRPQRVQAFAQDSVGRQGSAVRIASATHHTLTVTKAGALYAFGLGKGGRLGTGDEKPCATPVRVQGPLVRQRVVAAAAAENHSLCVTASGNVYAFGSNRFGQLGICSNESAVSLRCSPRRVDDLKKVFLIDVAAGAKHSVALSSRGEVYVWGDNGAGQLGISGRTSNNNSMHKPQRVEALCKGSHGIKKVIAIAASEAATLVLTPGATESRNVLVNMVYGWGMGTHVPCKVQFPSKSHGRPVNPIAISSARYHNVGITSDGEVYSWGLRADSLGTTDRRASQSSLLSAPQLVSGMLPENGGGKVVAVSASENHTAVVTNEGHLFTWGDTYSKNIMGHEGVRWQPKPKRVLGVHRAVAVSAAREHTALLIGASFPRLPPAPSLCDGTSLTSLEILAARKIAEHVDLFNIVPILITAERTQSLPLLRYCQEFVRRNLDGILNLGQKSVMDQYLNEQLVGCPPEATEKNRDTSFHPLIGDVVLAGTDSMLSFGQVRLCCIEKWAKECETLAEDPTVASILSRHLSYEVTRGKDRHTQYHNHGDRAVSFSESSISAGRERKRTESFCSNRSNNLISNMDLSTKELAEAKVVCLSKEVRSLRKRLVQISRLEGDDQNMDLLAPEQQRKLERKPQIEADIQKVQTAIALVEKKLIKFREVEFEQELRAETEREEKAVMVSSFGEGPEEVKPDSEIQEIPTTPAVTLRCDICRITCPDAKSHQLHLSGRKHRNRLQHAEDEQKKVVAAQMMEEQQRQILLSPSREEPTEKPAKRSPWNKTTSVHPKYKLPPPPHASHEVVNSPQSTPQNSKSLREIMAEESSLKKKASAPTSLELPPGSAPAMRSPPWASAKVKVCVPTVEPSWPTPLAAEAKPKGSPVTLNAFLRTPEPKPKPGTTATNWSTTPSPRVAPAKEAAASVSFLDIQQQEEHFKEKQDHSYGSNGKWFIERRERAGSFKEIQSETTEAEEHQRLVEEQMQIEKQIYESIAAEKAAEEKRIKKSNKRKNGRKKCPKNQKTNSTDASKQTTSGASGNSILSKETGSKKSRPRKPKPKSG